MDLMQIQRTGISAAYEGAKVLRSFLGNIKHINKKGDIDLVTEADTESEKVIIETIRQRYPEHSILAEESGLNDLSTNCQWIIDPLDGTTNFAHGLGMFAVSIAFALNNNIVAGIVLNPVTAELFTAIKDKGAFLNGNRITVSTCSAVSDSLLVTGFPYNLKQIINPLLQRFTACLGSAQGVRRLGSAALDLCFVACGRFDGFWEQNLKPWDTAAGSIIAREAGATLTDFSNLPYSIDKNEILATNGHIHRELISILALEDSV